MELDGLTPSQQRDALLELVPALVDKYGNVSSTTAADWYDQVRSAWLESEQIPDDGYKATTSGNPYDHTVLQDEIRYRCDALFPESGKDSTVLLTWLNTRLGKWIQQAGRDTIITNVASDPSTPRYARVPQGASCGFCIMLGSRGFVYSSAEAAGQFRRYHDSCDCAIVPSWDKTNPTLEGYDPEGLYERYLQCRNTLGDMITDGMSADDVTRLVCREMDWRDRQWLYDGTEPEITFETDELRQETENARPHELRTAERLRKHGVTPAFQIDYKLVVNKETGIEERVGLADWVGGIEIKTVDSAKSFRTIDGYIGNASKKSDCTRLIIDNTESKNLTDDQLIEFVRESNRFHGGIIYVLTKDQSLRRIK